MDRLRAMRTFVAVADAGSLSGAARALDEPLTNISRLLGQLEAHLDCPLVIRSTRRLALTPQGEDYLVTCRLLLDDLEGAEARIRAEGGELTGRITIAAPVAFGRLHVLPVLAAFLQRHPGVEARLELHDERRDLIEHGIDVAVRLGDLPDSGHLALHVGDLRVVTCASPGYVAARGRPVSPADIASHDLVSFSGPLGHQRWSFSSRAHGRETIRLAPRLQVNSAEAAVAAAEAGLGLTRVLSYQAGAALAAGRLVTLLDAYEDTPVPVHLVRWPSRIGNPRVRAFNRFAADALRARLAGAAVAGAPA